VNGSEQYVYLEGNHRKGTAKERGIEEARNDIRRATADTAEQGPEIQTMYSLDMPVSALRTKMRQEFERHRYVQQLKTVDVLLFNSHQEYQVRRPSMKEQYQK